MLESRKQHDDLEIRCSNGTDDFALFLALFSFLDTEAILDIPGSGSKQKTLGAPPTPLFAVAIVASIRQSRSTYRCVL